MSCWTYGTVYGDRDYTEEEATADANVLHDAMDGCGTNESDIIEVLVKINNSQRQKLAEAYSAAHGANLIEALKSDLSGDLEKIIIGLMYKPREYDALLLHDAMDGAGSDEDTLIGIMCTRTCEQIEEIKEAYVKEYENELIDDLNSDNTGDFGELLHALATAAREEGVNEDRVDEDVQALINAGVNAWGTDEDAFKSILCRRSYEHLNLVFQKYKEAREGTTLEEDIDSEMSGHLQNGLLAIVKIVQDPLAYFAERINKAVDGAGTDEHELIRVIICRAETDLHNVKNRFAQMYETSMYDKVAGDFSGACKQALLSIIQGTFVEDE